MVRLLIAMVLVITRAAAADSLSTLDQSADFPNRGYSSGPFIAQEFTVGRTGILTHAEVPLSATFDLTATGELQLLAMRDGKPSLLPADLLASVTFSISGGTFIWTPLENIDLHVSAGDKFAVALKGGSELLWSCFFVEEYDGGKPWLPINGDGDLQRWTTVSGMNFRTFVSPVPEPTPLVLGNLSLLAFAALRRRR